MKKIQLLIILFAFMGVLNLNAQQKKYISYTVKKGETLKSLAKIYKISRRDLSRLNPGVKRKPRPNTVIIVPNLDYGKVIVEEKNKESKEIENLYTVKPKETVTGISRDHGITIEELKAANPILDNGLKIGMKLNIPKPSITQLKDSINFVLHKVIDDDTFYNITSHYNVSEEDLLKLNPSLKEGVKLGMLLKIKPIEEIENAEDEVLFVENLDFSKEINLAIMLPYMTKKFDLDSIANANFKKSSSVLNVVTDFHIGAMMAIDSLKARGLTVNVNFFDTEGSKYKLQHIVNNHNFNNTDAIIGPLYFDKANWVASHVNTPVIAPVYSKKQVQNSDNNLVKSAVDKLKFEDKIITYFIENYNGENIVVINDEKEENQSKLWRIVNKIKKIDSLTSISTIKTKKGFIESTNFIQKLDTLSKNWVFLISDEKIATTAAVNNLKTFAEDVEVRLFSLAKGKNFNNIDNELLGKLAFTYPTDEFVNFEDTKVTSFYNKYWKKYKAIPTKYTLRGFDVTYDIIARISSNYDLKDGLKAGKSTRLASSFNYDKKIFGNFKNNEVFLIKYNGDLSVEILK